jgi:hypothetical protein
MNTKVPGEHDRLPDETRVDGLESEDVVTKIP